MTFWLALAVIIGTAVGLDAPQEQAQWQARQAAMREVAPAAVVPGAADRLAGEADLPLAWRVPWLSGVAAAVLVIGLGLAAEASAREAGADGP